MIGLISFEAKQAGERNARNWHVAFDAAGAGNVAWSRCCDTRRRKSELTGNTNFDLNRRASLRPYLREVRGEIPRTYSAIPRAYSAPSAARREGSFQSCRTSHCLVYGL
jgi:hypothetical protein